MPIHVYPPVVERVYASSKRRTFSGSCSTSGSSSIAETQSILKEIRIEQATGWRMEGWRKMINSGAILPFTRWDKYKLYGLVQPAHREWCASPTGTRNRWEDYYRGGAFLDRSSGDLMGYVDPIDLEYYVQKAAAAIYSQGWDALTFIAEIKQLRTMFESLVQRFVRLVKGKRDNNPLEMWLEGRFGWRTLLYDIEDFTEVLKRSNERRTRYRESKGFNVSGSWSEYLESTSSGMISGTSSEINWTGSLRGTVVADIEIPDFQFNALTTAWEVARLSFVIDWFFNVGQALEAASFLLKAGNYKAGGGYKFDFVLSQSVNHVGVTGSTICHANDGSCSGIASVIKRQPMSVSAIPQVKVRLDEWKILDLLSLVVTSFFKR